MRDITHRRLEYQRLLDRLVDLWLDPDAADRTEINRVNARLLEMVRQDGIKKDRRRR